MCPKGIRKKERITRKSRKNKTTTTVFYFMFENIYFSQQTRGEKRAQKSKARSFRSRKKSEKIFI